MLQLNDMSSYAKHSIQYNVSSGISFRLLHSCIASKQLSALTGFCLVGNPTEISAEIPTVSPSSSWDVSVKIYAFVTKLPYKVRNYWY